MKEQPRLVFMGTPDFAAQSLAYLADRFTIDLVISQPDRPRGRGKKLLPSPVKAKAMELHLPVATPEHLARDSQLLEEIEAIQPDFLIVVAYGQILSEEVLRLAAIAPINLHASLLPAYRGAAPIQAAILAGDAYSGNTTMWMDKGLDTGDILLQDRVEIPEDMTFGQLHDELMDRGGPLLEETILGLWQGTLKRTPQPEAGVSYVPKFTKAQAQLDFSQPAKDLVLKVRALNPMPLAFALTPEGDRVKILRALALDEKKGEAPGSLLAQSPQGIDVATGEGIFRILELQVPGKRPMAVKDFLNGKRFAFEAFGPPDNR